MIIRALKPGGVCLRVGIYPTQRTYRIYQQYGTKFIPDDEATEDRAILDKAVEDGFITIEVDTDSNRLSSISFDLPFLCSATEQVGDLVCVSSPGTVTQAIASVSSKIDVIGHIVSKASATECVVSGNLGPLTSSGLTSGARIFLSSTVAGGIATTPPASPSAVVDVGVASSSTSWVFTGAKILA